jgi:disulfide bond formation protein DsbB
MAAMTLAARLRDPRVAAALVLAAAVATIGGAYVFEYGLGYIPCPLCLMQRKPYYVAMALALAAALVPNRVLARIGLALVALVFVVSAGLGAYHAGVEWGLWLGPSDCAGAPAAAAGNVTDFMQSLQKTRVVSCTEAAWRFLGLSLAGWNVLISLALAAFAALAAVRPGGEGGKRPS